MTHTTTMSPSFLRVVAWFPGPAMLRITRARWTKIDFGQNGTESLVHMS